MSKSNSKKKIFVFILIIVAIISIAIIALIKKPKIHNDLDYCREICKEIEKLNFDQFDCVSINNNDSQHVQFNFILKDYDQYSKKKCISDISMVRETIATYLDCNPDNELNDKLLICAFETSPGDLVYMYNYNFKEEQKLQQPDKLMYFQYLYADFSQAQIFSDAKIIELKVEEDDDLSLLREWHNLEYLNISGYGLSKEKIQFLSGILQDCTIVCNGSEINK